MDDLSLRVYLENGSDAMRGGWLELPVVPERLDAFMRGVVGVDDGGGYAVVDHEPGWFGDVLGSDLESFSVSSLNLAARCVAHARDLAVADSVDGDVFLDMLATAAESEDVRFPSGIAALAARAGDVAEFWTEYSLPDSWRAGNSSPDELYGAHVAYGLMGDDAYSSLSYCMDLERLGRDEASNAGVTPGASGFVSDHEPLAPSGPVPDGALDALEAFASGWRPPSAEYRPFDIADIVCEGETVADYTLEGDGTNWGAPVYQCVVDDGFDAGSDVFGVDVLSALEDTLRRIRSARAGMGDFDEVAREVMGVEQFRPEMYDDDYGSDPHAADKVAAWAECWEVDDPRVLAGVAVRSADIPIHRYSRPRGMDDLQWRGLDPLGRLGASMSEERGLYGALRSGGVADSFDYAGYAYAAREDDDRQMWCSDDGYIVDADLPNMPPLSARGLEDAVAALETGAAVMDPADPTNMAVTAAESGRAL